ncbi:PucR family transcriptional regulator ligand-binding domain-containing protein [Gordonia sp. PKS22-38]|uniref:PucR family transcriptional regulator ligand-binding domain-containing protein n=1 Tax=Gordonia prachuapensis TaxID=3115651 RepID=A0ABU7MNG5_9ACTN|nr:PucR family transcriptional regulator ligand-binding domain-containing protein [Gordonia sp. PKS22-38]
MPTFSSPTSSATLPSLREVIALHLAAADPRVLTAHERLGNPVRWVHSSEIFEIGPLLTGGELLLTTGLGLRGLDAGTRRHYVRDLAERGVAGLAFEVGRTFDVLPDEMVQEGSASRLPIIELRRVQPFIDICRRANTAIVAAEVDELRLRARLDEALHTDLVSPGGVAGMLGSVAEATGCPVVLIGSGGALLAAHGVDDDRSAWRIVEAASATTPVVVRGREIARLVAGTGAGHPSDRVERLLEVAAGPVAATLTRSGTRGSTVGTRLVEEIVGGRAIRRADLLARLVSAGVGRQDSARLVTVAAEAPDPRMADAALARAAGSVGGIVSATVDATVYALMVTTSATDPVGETADAIAAVRGIAGGMTTVVGDAHRLDDAPPGIELSARLAESLRRAGERIGLANDLSIADPTRQVFTSRELVTHAAVRAVDDDVRAEIADLLSPLIVHDGPDGRLLTTLETHLRLGCSATRSAEVLHIGRQSLYQRLDRIRGVLGFDPTAPDIYTSVLLAIAVERTGGRRR